MAWGLPERVRVDNGAPWGGPGDLPPALALWWIGLGLDVVWNPVYCSEANGVVERTHGVLALWTEPACCASREELQRRLTWAIALQRGAYPVGEAPNRLAAFPSLLSHPRPYTLDQEDPLWNLQRVDAFFAQQMWERRVSPLGQISLYDHHYSVGRAFARQTIFVRFDPASREWVFLTPEAQELKRHPTRELTRKRILALQVAS